MIRFGQPSARFGHSSFLSCGYADLPLLGREQVAHETWELFLMSTEQTFMTVVISVGPCDLEMLDFEKFELSCWIG